MSQMAYWLLSGALGLAVGLIVLAVGLSMDKYRERRWHQELTEGYAPTDIVDLPKQRKGDDA